MKQNSDIFACTTQKSDSIYVFHHNTNTKSRQEFSPDLILSTSSSSTSENIAKTKAVNQQQWNPNDAGKLVSCSKNSDIHIHDVREGTNPIMSFTRDNSDVKGSNSLKNEACFNDVRWHPFIKSVFATCSSDGNFQIWDSRSKNKCKSSSDVIAHTEDVSSLTFSGFDESLMITGSKDRTLALWDLRNLSVKVHSLTGHANAIEKVSFFQLLVFSSVIFFTFFRLKDFFGLNCSVLCFSSLVA